MNSYKETKSIHLATSKTHLLNDCKKRLFVLHFGNIKGLFKQYLLPLKIYLKYYTNCSPISPFLIIKERLKGINQKEALKGQREPVHV